MTKPAYFNMLMVLGFCFSQMACKSQQLIPHEKSQSEVQSYFKTGNFDIIKKDNLGHIYLLQNGNLLLKCDKNGKTVFQFSIRGLGHISNIDISNPQKIMLYYPDYQNIVFLDNTLSEINRLNLEQMGFWDIQGVAVSRDNNIWIHDPINNRLLKVNTAGNIQFSSNELFHNKDDDTSNPQVFEFDDRVFLFNQSSIKEYDNFGQLIKTYAVKNQGIQFNDASFYYLDQDKIFRSSYQLHFNIKDQIQELFSGSQIRDFVVDRESIFIIDAKGVLHIKR